MQPLRRCDLTTHCLLNVLANKTKPNEKVIYELLAPGFCGIERKCNVAGPGLEENLEDLLCLEQIFT